MKKLLLALGCCLLVLQGAWAAMEAPHVDRVPSRAGDLPSLQRGARMFVNYCMGCHSAASLRYNRLTELGLSEKQIADNFIFSGERVGSPMTIAMSANNSKDWFGTPPPDLTLVVRARTTREVKGADWVYTYLRSFYRDPTRPTGWNNKVFPNVAMPHVLQLLQGDQILEKNGELKLVNAGAMTPAQYNAAMVDLVGFLAWMGEPQATMRHTIGWWVLALLLVLVVLTYLLKREFWKDVH